MSTALFFLRNAAATTGAKARSLMVCVGMAAGLLLGIAAPLSQAQESLFVADSTYVPLRTGQGNQYRIRMNLKTGDKLRVLEQPTEDSQWIHVATEAGTDGWVQSQYLSKEAPAKLQLEYATQRVAKLEQQLQELKQQNRELTGNNAELTKNLGSQTQSHSNTEAELQRIKTLSADAIALESRYRELEQKHAVVAKEKDRLAAENSKLNDDQRIDFMVYGAVIMICGILVAIIVPALKPKKRHSEWR